MLGAFGLPPELSRLSGRELQEAIDRIRKIQRDLSPEEVAGGKAAAESIEDISLALKNLRDRVGAGLAPDLAAIAKSLADFANLHSDEVVGALRDLATWVKSADWAAVGRDLRDFASGANNVAQALGGWKPVLEFLAAYKIAQLLGLTSAIGGLARALGTLGAVASPPAWLLALLGVAGAVAADRDRQRRGEKGPGGLYGTPLYGFGPMGEPDLIPQGPEDGFRGNQGDKGEAAPAGKPLWRRLFDNINQEGGLLHKSSFEVPEDWKGALKGGAGADSRGAEGVIERGVLQALRDFAAEQKPGDAGGGGGGGSGIGAIKAAYQPGGAGGFGGAGNAAGEPSAGGGAGVGGGPASEPMGTLGGKPVGVEQLGGGLNRDAFNKMFSGTPLAGHADDVIKAARENGVSPSLMAGIMAHETGRGTSAMLRQKNNPAGLMHGSTGMQFGSIGEGIAAAGRTIGKNFRAGGGTIEGMAKTYAPVGAANDPGGLNAGWPSGVRRFMSQLEGGSASPPRFNVGDVKTALAGSSGTAAIREGLARERGIYGSANLFSSGRAAAAGIPGGVGRNLTKITTAGGHTMTVNAEAAPHFKSFVEDLERRGYNIRDLGSLAIRGKRGGGGMSEHAFGNAIDINPAQNPFHSSRTDMPKGVEDIAAKYGLTWGGTWRPGSRDPMHFEWTGKPDVPDAMHGEALKRHFGVGQRSKPNPDLLGSARQSGLVGPPLKHEVTGSAHLKIDLGGFPKGTTTKMRNDGELFKTVALSRGRAMPPASQTG